MKADVVVLGGGPAGGMTALLLARAGHSVVLCEPYAALPERVCGMYLCPAGVTLLERLGLGEALGAGRRQLRGMVMVAPSFQRLETYFPSGKCVADHGLALLRPELDHKLLDLARAAGTMIRMGTRPKMIERVGGGWRVTLPDGEAVEARLLVGADGRKSSTARLLGLTLPLRRTRAAIHINRPTLVPAKPLGQMHIFEDGAYVGINPVDPHTVNVSFVCDPIALRGLPVVTLINDHIARSPHLSELVAPLPEDARPGATFPINARVRRAATHDAALVGDASGYVDPLTGEGIYAAFWTAEELARAVTAGWSDLPAALDRYARERARRQRAKSALCEIFQYVIRRPWLSNSVFRVLARRPEVGDSFIGIVGNSYSPAHGLGLMALHSFSY